jgi:hypothetical protein
LGFEDFTRSNGPAVPGSELIHNSHEEELVMSAENKSLVRRWFEEVSLQQLGIVNAPA